MTEVVKLELESMKLLYLFGILYGKGQSRFYDSTKCY